MVKKNNFLLLFVFSVLVIFTVDLVTKWLILHYKPVWGKEFFSIHFVSNTGAGFGILQGQTFWLGMISLLVGCLVIWHYKEIPKEKFSQVLWGVFLGGVLGNLIDRLFRGYVIDFIDFWKWPAFNVADMAISLSIIGLVIYYWRK